MEEKSEKKKMGTGKKIGIGCLGIVLLFIIIGIVSSSGKNKSTTYNLGSGNNSSGSKTDFNVNEAIKLNNHQLLITNYKQGYKSSNQFDTPQGTDNEFVTVDITITNTGSSDLLVNDWGFKLEDETGTQRNTTLIAGVNDGLQSVTLSPNGKTSGKLSFEAKKNSKTLKLHYSPGLLGGESIVVNLK